MNVRSIVLLSLGIKISIILVCLVLVGTHSTFGRVRVRVRSLFSELKSPREIKRILERGLVDVNARNSEGQTALMVAAARGDIKRAQVFIDKGANLNLKAVKDGNTALHSACYNADMPNNPALVELLVLSGADSRAVNNAGETPLFHLLQVDDLTQRLRLFWFLIKHGADINAKNFQGRTMLHVSVDFRDRIWITKIKKEFGSLIKWDAKEGIVLSPGAGKKPSSKKKPPSTAANVLPPAPQKLTGNTAAEYAYSLGFRNVGDILNEKIDIIGAVDPNAFGPGGLTGLMFAVMRNDKKFADSLLQRGARVNAKSDDEYGNTALHIALLHANIPMVEFLLTKYAHMTIQNKQGNTPLHAIAFMHDPNAISQAMQAMIKRGVDINLPNKDGNTLLHLAIMQNNDVVLKQLFVIAGARLNLSAQNENYKTALEIAREKGLIKGQESIANRLEQFERDPQGTVQKILKKIETKRKENQA